jgi:hypothetical protein
MDGTRPDRVTLTLELERGAAPIQGSLAFGAQPTRGFAGWLELIGVVEELLAAPPEEGRQAHVESDGLKTS